MLEKIIVRGYCIRRNEEQDHEQNLKKKKGDMTLHPIMVLYIEMEYLMPCFVLDLLEKILDLPGIDEMRV